MMIVHVTHVLILIGNVLMLTLRPLMIVPETNTKNPLMHQLVETQATVLVVAHLPLSIRERHLL